MTSPQLPNAFSSGNTIVAADLQENFDEVESILGNLDTNNLADDAGLVAAQIADRYVLVPNTFVLVPYAADLTSSTGATAEIPITSSDIDHYKMRLRAPTGTKQWIAMAEWHVMAQNADTTDVRVQAVLEGTVLGGGWKDLDASGYHFIKNADAMADPIAPYADGDELVFKISGNGNNPTIRAVTVTIWSKVQLSA